MCVSTKGGRRVGGRTVRATVAFNDDQKAIPRCFSDERARRQKRCKLPLMMMMSGASGNANRRRLVEWMRASVARGGDKDYGCRGADSVENVQTEQQFRQQRTGSAGSQLN